MIGRWLSMSFSVIPEGEERKVEIVNSAANNQGFNRLKQHKG